MFVDYKQAFDNLWIEGCVGKLRRIGIPGRFVEWIKAWLINRRCFVEILGARSRWFAIERGGPQGSTLTPSVFISYHSDMDNFIQKCSAFYFADDLAAVMAGHIGIRYLGQCLDLEKKLKVFFDYLEYYSLLAAQPINYEKTEAFWSARAWGVHEGPKFNIWCGDHQIKWCSAFKYLGYWISPKLGWSTMISKTVLKIRQRIGMINSCRIYGTSSRELRRVLFSTYVLPFFTWLFAIFPLFSPCQRRYLSHFYLNCLKRVMHSQQWPEPLFMIAFNELSLENRCTRYWNKYLQAIADSKDGELLMEPLIVNTHRKNWLEGTHSVRWLRRSERFSEHETVVQKILEWIEDNPLPDTIPHIPADDIELLKAFPETF